MSRQQLRTFLKKLEKTNMIEVKSNQLLTHLIIVGYQRYNDYKSTKSQPTNNHIIRKKESKNKENKDFDLFWEHYPKKVAKKKVQDKFNSNNYRVTTRTIPQRYKLCVCIETRRERMELLF